MNIRLVPSVSRWLLSVGFVVLATGHASGVDFSQFRRIEPQFIAALGDASAIVGFLGQGSGAARLQAGPLSSVEGDGGGSGAVEV
jgi:hypothetical protein